MSTAVDDAERELCAIEDDYADVVTEMEWTDILHLGGNVMKGKLNIVMILFIMCVLMNVQKVNASAETGTVKEINKEIVTVMDHNGNLWDFYGDGYRKGDRVQIVFNRNHTKVINCLTDKDLVRKYVKTHHKSRKVKWIKGMPKKHKSNKYIYVSKVISKSYGRYGITRSGGRIRYNTKAPKGKCVVSYLIWNPRNNCHDDVVAVVDNAEVR